MTEKLELKLNPANVKIQVKERSRGRMKIQIKLGSDEALAYKNFVEQLKPDEITFDDFTKAVFFTGLHQMGENLQQSTIDYVKSHQEELEASGMDVKKFFEDVENVEQVDG
tara:strand:+ start:162 stop:494 length:333 start_codon:yes stop_codon:yes gene_type:complete